MKAISKTIGKFNQYVGEKFSSAQKHELSEEFKQLEGQIEVRKEGTDAILVACTQYIKTLDKKKEAADKQKRPPLESLGIAMVQYGSDLHEDSAFGQALVKMGASEEKISETQSAYASKLRETFLKQLEVYMTDMKAYKHLRSKLESRRLDYDAKLNKIQKSKKENPQLDEEVRIAQQKYEETLEEVEKMMIALNNREEPQMQALLEFVDAQCQYHKDALEIAEQMKARILDSSIKGERVTRRVSKFSSLPASSSNLSGQATPSRSSTHEVNGNIEGQNTLQVPVTSNRQYSEVSATNSVVVSQYHTPYSSTSALDSSMPKPPRPAAPKKLVRANYSFTAENKDELTINKGDVITVINEIDQGWWIGESNGVRGMFPANYCSVIESQPVVESAEPSHQPGSGLPRSTSIPKFSYGNNVQPSPANLKPTAPPSANNLPPVNYGSKPNVAQHSFGTPPTRGSGTFSRSSSEQNLIGGRK